jgi:hypothetical protein
VDARFVGSWELVDHRYTAGGQPDVRPWDAFAGVLVYTADGVMSVQMMSLAPVDATASTAAVSQRAPFIAYAGRYQVDDAAATVRHHIAVAVFPAWRGTIQARSFRFAADTLVLSSPPLVDEASGATFVARSTWRRSK